jgi:hypothetical protein
VIIVIGAVVLLLALVPVGFVVVRIGATLSTRERIAFGVVIVLAALYFLPGLIHTTVSSYRIGVELRESQGR